MDEKTRNSFEMNLWNPTAIHLADNQIYARCDDLLDGEENHYCTPVPSRQTSGMISSTMALTHPPTMPRRRSIGFRHNISRKQTALASMSILTLLLILIAIACSTYGLVELGRLQSKVDMLEREVDLLHQSQAESKGELNVSIMSARTQSQSGLVDLEERLTGYIDNVSLDIRTDMSLVTGNIESDLSELSEVIRGNISSVAKMLSLDFMELAEQIQANITHLSTDLGQLQSTTQTNLTNLQDEVNSRTSQLRASIDHSISQLENMTTEVINQLNATAESGISHLTSEISALERAASNNISSLSLRSKSDFEHITSTHFADTSRLTSFIAGNFSNLSTRIEQTESDARRNISSLHQEVLGNFSTAQNQTASLISSLTAEVERVEFELAQDAHANLTRLDFDLRDQLNELSTSLRWEFAHLENETRIALTNVSSETYANVSALQLEAYSNLTSQSTIIRKEINLYNNETRNFVTEVSDDLRTEIMSGLNQVTQSYTVSLDMTKRNITELLEDTRTMLYNLTVEVAHVQDNISALELELARNITATKEQIEQDLVLVSQNVEIGFRESNMSRSMILSHLQDTDSRVDESEEQLNRSRNDIQALVLEVVELNGSLASTQDSLSVTINNLQRLNISTEAGFLGINHSLIILESDFTNLAANFTYLHYLTQDLDSQLENLRNETHSEFDHLVLTFEQALSDVEKLIITNFTFIQAILLDLNASLHQEIQTEILEMTSSLSALLADNVSQIYSSINETSSITRYETDTLNRSISDVKESLSNTNVNLNITRVEVSNLFTTLDEMRESLVELVGNSSDNLNESFSAVLRGLREDIELTRDDVASLEQRTHENITNSEEKFLQDLLLLENMTQSELEDLRSLFSYLRLELARNVSIVAEELRYLLYQLNASLTEIENETASSLAGIRLEMSIALGNLELALVGNISHASENLELLIHQLNTSLIDMLLQSEDSTRSTIRLETSDAVSDLQSLLLANLTRTSEGLENLIHQLNTSLLDMLSMLSSETQNDLLHFVQSTNVSITALLQSGDALASNLTALTETANNITLNQITVVSEVSSLRSNVSDLRADLTVESANLSTLARDVESLGHLLQQEINSSVDLYGGCLQDVTECDRSSTGREYFIHCTTAAQPINITVNDYKM